MELWYRLYVQNARTQLLEVCQPPVARAGWWTQPQEVRSVTTAKTIKAVPGTCGHGQDSGGAPCVSRQAVWSHQNDAASPLPKTTVISEVCFFDAEGTSFGPDLGDGLAQLLCRQSCTHDGIFPKRDGIFRQCRAPVFSCQPARRPSTSGNNCRSSPSLTAGFLLYLCWTFLKI